ncbi:MAG: DUF3106 domain-containing protein [Planctomycetes bacterium]|nr:DUF3106 domain-containing protein [Planctomycetota bacterium]
MARIALAISIMLLAAAGRAAQPRQAEKTAAGNDDTAVLTRPPRGSLAAQLRLKLSLRMAGGVSLAASLDHNRQEWQMLSPDERERFRSYVLAFLQKDPKSQEKLLKNYNTFLSLTKEKQRAYRRRAEWVRIVAASFTPEQREQLRRMSSLDRARAYIARRDLLIRQGKLKLSGGPTSAPAAGRTPASRPAAGGR